MKLTKSQIKELIRHSIRELASEREDVTESKKRRFTVKEVRMWMKKLEENRYKKVYNSDARRVAWMVNNEGRTLDEMPMSMKKKWSKAQYGRERYLATEFLKSKSEQLSEGLDLKKLETAIKDFQNKIKKQGRVTNARDEDHLKNLIKIYKQMGGKKIKESVNERLNQSQAKTLLRQLGGNKFIMMTGAKQMSIGKKGLTMKIGRNSKSITHVAIDLDRGKDLYTMKFIRVRKGIPKVVKKYDSIYADNLNNIFEKETGLYTRL